MLCAASETVADVSNSYLLDPTSAFTIYPPTAGPYFLAQSSTASASRLQYVDVYMNDLNCATQGDVGQHQQASELTIWDLKEIFPSLPTEVKYLVSLKNHCRTTAAGPRSKKYLVGSSALSTVPCASLTNSWQS